MHTFVFVCPLSKGTKCLYPRCYAVVNDDREIVFYHHQLSLEHVELLQLNISYGIQVERKIFPRKYTWGRSVGAVYEKERNRFLRLECLRFNRKQMQLVSIGLNTDSRGIVGVKDAKMSFQTFNLDGWNNRTSSYMQTDGDFLSYLWMMFLFIRTDGPATILLCKQQQMIEIDRSNIGVGPTLPYRRVEGPDWRELPCDTYYDPSDKLVSLTFPNIWCYDFKTGVQREIQIGGPCPILDGCLSVSDHPSYHDRVLSFNQGEATLFFYDKNEQQIECWKLDLAEERWIQIGSTAAHAGLATICVLGAEKVLITGWTKLEGEERCMVTSLVWSGEGPKSLRRMCFETILVNCKDRSRLAKFMTKLGAMPRMLVPVQRA